MFRCNSDQHPYFRYKLKYLSIHYFPSGLFVVISWFSFLIPPEIVAGRMSMLITLFLVLINICTSITRHVLKVKLLQVKLELKLQLNFSK